MTDLREKAARLLLQRAYQESLDAGLLDDFTAKYHDRFLAHADAILAIARPVIIEECAKIVDWYAKAYAISNIDWKTGGTSGLEFFTLMAAAIRHLKGAN